jgi:PAS domain S-box-containing protein
MDGLLDQLPCGVVSYSDDGTVLFANSTLSTMLGYARAEIEGRHIEQLLPLASKIFFQTHFYPLVRLHGHAEELFLLLRQKDGSDIGALINARRREHDGGWVTDCAIMEVRERRKYEDALLRAKRAAEEAHDVLALRTRDLEAANDTLERQATELEAQQYQLEEQAAELELQSDALSSANDALMIRADELEEARLAADDANRAKTQFVTVMSHELRTPLNAIGGYAQLLELGVHGAMTESQLGALGRIVRAQKILLGLINDLLDLARIEAGRVEYHIQPVATSEVISAVLPMLEPQMRAGGLTPIVGATDALVATDRDKFQQILINLLTNAVKFTPAGGTITLGVRASNDEEFVHVDVADSGIGVKAEHLARLFEPFVQVDDARTKQREGSGLGLAISRNLARAMGGDLVATSELGVGSTFTLKLPIAR